VKGSWNQRAFVATGALLFGLTLPVTGLVDHVVRDHRGAAAVGRWSVAHIAWGRHGRIPRRAAP
jgi:hypothetical protein